MQLVKHSNPSTDTIPLLAALTYSIVLDKADDMKEESGYDPTSQRTVYAMGGRNHSTSRVDDSVGGLFNAGSIKSDTKRDD